MKDEGRKGRASPWGEVASRSDDGEGFTIRKHKDSRPLSVALRAPAPPEGSLSLHPEQIQNLQSYELCGILDIEKDNRPQGGLPSLVKKNPLRTRQSRGAVFLCLGYLQY